MMWKAFSLNVRFVGFWNFLKFPSSHSCHRFEKEKLKYTSLGDSRLRYLYSVSIYTYVCICICTHMGVYILAPFLQAFVFKGSPQRAWCFFISAELLMGRGFGCLHTFTVQDCDHCRQISQMNETLINLAELLFFQKALSLGWLQTYIFVNVTDNRERKERRERNEESFKQSCFELPPWRCSVPTLHLDMCLQMATWAHLCPFPRLVGCAPTPVTSCRAHLAPHGARWWYTAYEQLLQLEQA